MTVPYTYFYNAQIRRYISQFSRIFSGIQVKYGDGTLDNIPIHYGLPDRVVASYLQDRKTFVADRVPLFSTYLTNIERNDDRAIPKRYTDTVSFDTNDGTGNRTWYRVAPAPYKMEMTLYLYASNSDQMFQMMEQIMLMFNPELPIQRSSELSDWNYLSNVKLESINNETSHPISQDARIIQRSITFRFDAIIEYPLLERDDEMLEKIILNIKDETVEPQDIETVEVTANQE